MNLSAPFIQRPIATVLLMAGLAAVRACDLSAVAGRRAAERQLPDDPDLGAAARRRPANDGLVGGNPARAAVQPDSRRHPAHLVQRAWRDPAHRPVRTLATVDSAAVDVLAAINAASPFLPPNIPYPPTIRKVNPAETPILLLALTSDTLPLTTVDAYAENILLPKISQIAGVGLVGIGGQQKPAIRVQVNPQALAARGIGLEDVRNVIAQAQRRPAEGHAQQPARRPTRSTPTISCSSPTPMKT